MPGGTSDDEFVANLLKQDAKDATRQYELVGIEAFSTKRSRNGAPKPNTNFLRHIIRQTDNHNAALLAKEAEESRARLRDLNRESNKGKGRDIGRLTPPADLHDGNSNHDKRRKVHADDVGRRWRKTRKHMDSDEGDRQRSEKDGDHKRYRKQERDGSKDRAADNRRSHRKSRHSERHLNKDKRQAHSSDEEGCSHRRHRRKRSMSRSVSRARSSSPRSSNLRKSEKRRRRSRSPRVSSHGRKKHESSMKHQDSYDRVQKPEPLPGEDSDPLETILGPLPPPAVRSRGRGAQKVHSTEMDARFSSTYDPAADVQLEVGATDDWDDALEALRDRQRWKTQGAERLKAAGFSIDQVRRWEKGDDLDASNVVWASRGQAREWDRGKVVDGEGDVALKPEWGRLT